jgi:hypothetical protein
MKVIFIYFCGWIARKWLDIWFAFSIIGVFAAIFVFSAYLVYGYEGLIKLTAILLMPFFFMEVTLVIKIACNFFIAKWNLFAKK